MNKEKRSLWFRMKRLFVRLFWIDVSPDMYAYLEKQKGKNKFNPAYQYGDSVYVMPSQFSDIAVEEAKRLLVEISIDPFVPEEYRKYVKWIVTHPNPRDAGSCAYGTVAWKIGPLADRV